MDAAEKFLDLLFRRIPPERLLRQVCRQARRMPPPLSEDHKRAVFLQFADTVFHGYSEDEQNLLYSQLEQSVLQGAEALHCSPSVFLPLVNFGQEVLTVEGEEPLCRSSRVLNWRSAYHLFGQDMIVCAYLASLDARNQLRRTDFAWPAVLRTDDRVLRRVLSSGIAENHFHLTGSTQSFAVVWCLLMNDPASICNLPEDYSSLLQSTASRGPDDNVLPMEERLTVAALVRSILFLSLTGRSGVSSERNFCKGYLECLYPLGTLTDRVRPLQTMYGVRLPLPDGGSLCLDYALELPVFQAVKDSPYRALAGERCFLYRCFAACFNRRFTRFERALFHLYLSLKTAFRGEMIQVNRQVGFLNFKNYQDRKDMAWEGPFWWESCRMALSAPLRTEPIRSLEARITPAMTGRAMIGKVLAYDRGERFAEQPCRPVLTPEEPLPDPELAAEQFLKEPYFYVVHFPKLRDDDPPPAFALRHRHQALREKVWTQAVALADALSVSAYLCSRVRGVDACSNEVDCRPEVFASAFRFLRGFQTTDLSASSALLPRFRHRLSLTYHAGEDFYDIADGLRAIDETVCFLDYRRGDRIGHALALGVDPRIHYQTKSMHIVLPRQNYLDNLVWLLYRGRALGVRIDPQQYGRMQQDALELLRKIYGPVMEDNGLPVTLQDYYCSMMLRGDDPRLYQTMSFCKPDGMDEYGQWLTAPDLLDRRLAAFRSSRTVALLYACYHYNRRVNLEGRKPARIPVRPEYITVVGQVQEAMQRYLAERGIIIECNPSSNVLIGTFGEYGRHPIMRFNNLDLAGLEEGGCPQLQVCINTDDLGVFDTSLEFEYALLYHALSKQSGKDGHPRYNRESILRYLRSVQEMGMQAVFPPCREP